MAAPTARTAARREAWLLEAEPFSVESPEGALPSVPSEPWALESSSSELELELELEVEVELEELPVEVLTAALEVSVVAATRRDSEAVGAGPATAVVSDKTTLEAEPLVALPVGAGPEVDELGPSILLGEPTPMMTEGFAVDDPPVEVGFSSEEEESESESEIEPVSKPALLSAAWRADLGMSQLD